MTAPALATEPACPGSHRDPPTDDTTGLAAAPRLRAERRAFADIPAATWDALVARSPWATPFSAWAFHRAWWDAYGDNAHEETLVLVPADAPAGADPVAIVPLMHRHEHEPADEQLHTRLRGDPHIDTTPVPPTAKAVFFGASYHADYATILAAPADLADVAEALAAYWAGPDCGDWDAIDLRRLRCGDPAADALAAAIGAREIDQGWTLNVEREDVCPVATLPLGGTMDDYLATLGKKERHEIRRKVRRAEASGPIELRDAADPLADLEAFIDLHQRRWGADGLFPPTPGGDQSRVFIRRAFELFGAGRAAAPDLPDRRRPAHRGRHPLPDGRRDPVLQRRRGSRCPRPVAGRGHGLRLRPARPGRRPAPDGLPARRRVVQVRVGLRSTSPSSDCSSDEG